MASLRKTFKKIGHWLSGDEVVLDTQLRFKDIGNSIFDSTNGTVSWFVKTAEVFGWRMRDNVKGQDIIQVDTVDDVVRVLYDTEIQRPTMLLTASASDILNSIAGVTVAMDTIVKNTIGAAATVTAG